MCTILENRLVSFTMGGMAFEYDEQKNQINIRKHGLSFKNAARVFFDYDRIEFYDDDTAMRSRVMIRSVILPQVKFTVQKEIH